MPELGTQIGRGRQGANAQTYGYDIRKVKAALNRLGFYSPDEKTGMTEVADAALFTAIENFQRRHALFADGSIAPGNATERALDRAVAERNGRPIPGWYVWRSAADGKVRDTHALREGQVFGWGNPPKGGHPGEDYNCRCWTQNYVPGDPASRALAQQISIRAAARRKIIAQEFHGLNDDGVDALLVPLDAINPAFSPLDLIAPGGIAARGILHLGFKKVFFSKKVNIGTKIFRQMNKRGWSKKEIEDVITKPEKRIKTKDARYTKSGERKNDPATAFLDKDGNYVVRNDKTGDIVQISNKHKKNWKSPF